MYNVVKFVQNGTLSLSGSFFSPENMERKQT